MEGLILTIGLIFWFISSLKKKNKADQERIRTIQERKLQYRRETNAKMELEAQKLHTPSVDKIHSVYPSVLAEGESIERTPESAATFEGSLPNESLEGECICQPELEHDREIIPLAESVYANEMNASRFVDVSPRGIMQAVVMNEILTRPKQRVRRY